MKKLTPLERELISALRFAQKMIDAALFHDAQELDADGLTQLGEVVDKAIAKAEART